MLTRHVLPAIHRQLMKLVELPTVKGPPEQETVEAGRKKRKGHVESAGAYGH